MSLDTRCVEAETCAVRRRISIEESLQIEHTSGQCLVSCNRKLQVDQPIVTKPDEDAPRARRKRSGIILLLRAMVRFMISLVVEDN